jgi:ankyrin repeat protein
MLNFRKIKRQEQQAAKVQAIGLQLLDACRRSHQSLARLQELVESCPEAVAYKDNEERTSLHVACSNQANLFVVQFLVQKGPPDTIQQATTKGLLPLHYACREQCDLSVIEFLVQRYVEGLSHTTASGWLPLHLACARQAPVAVVQYLVKQNTESVQQATLDGRLALHFACANQAPLSVVRFLTQYHYQAIQQKDDHEWNPMHIACAYSPSLDVIEYLVDQWKEGLREPGYKGRLPLHVACLEKRPIDFVVLLTAAYPRALQEPDQDGLLPLQAACEAGAPLDVIQFLIQECPESVYEIGRTPQEMAAFACAGRTPTAEFLEWMHQIVETTTKEGMTFRFGQERNDSQGSVSTVTKRTSSLELDPRLGPMTGRRSRSMDQVCDRDIVHDSIEFKGTVHCHSMEYPSLNTSTEFRISQDNSQVLLVEEVNAQAENGVRMMEQPPPSHELDEVEKAKIQTFGKLLHQACEMPQNLQSIQEIVSRCPKSIGYKEYGILPMHTACVNQAPLEVIHYLCENYPKSCRELDDEGNLPLHLACYSSAPLDSIQYLVRKWPECLQETNRAGDTPLLRAQNPFYDDPNDELLQWLQSQPIISSVATTAVSIPTRAAAPCIHRQPYGHSTAPAASSPPRTTAPDSSTTRPGAVMVNEPAVRPDSVMYQQAYGQPPAPRGPSNCKPLPKSLGVDELQARLEAIRMTKMETRRQTESVERNDEEELLADEPPTVGRPDNNMYGGQQNNIEYSSQYVAPRPPSTPISNSTSTNNQRTLTPTLPVTAQPRSNPAPSAGPSTMDTPTTIPGAVMVNEPAIRPDSAMFRAAYGDSNTATSSTRSVGPAFPPPLGIDAVQETLNALRETKKKSRRQMDPVATGEAEDLEASLNALREAKKKARHQEEELEETRNALRETKKEPRRQWDLVAAGEEEELEELDEEPRRPGQRSRSGTPPRSPLRHQGATRGLNPPAASPLLSPVFSSNSNNTNYVAPRSPPFQPPFQPQVPESYPPNNNTRIPSQASSFYKAAFEESKLMEMEHATRHNVPVPLASNPLEAGAPVKAAHIASPASASSFYKKALEESQMMENGGNTNGTLKMPPPSAMAGEEGVARAPNDDNLYDSLMRYHEEHDDVDDDVPGPRRHVSSLAGIDEDDLKPRATPTRTGDARSSYGSALPPALGQEVASSFYRAALEAGRLEATGRAPYAGGDAPSPMDSPPSASNNNSNHRQGPLIRQEVPSSFYRAAMLAAEAAESQPPPESAPYKPASKPGVVMVNEPVVRPDSAMYRQAQGNRNARYDHYS